MRAATAGRRRGRRATRCGRRPARGDRGRGRARARGPPAHGRRAEPQHRVERRAQGVPRRRSSRGPFLRLRRIRERAVELIAPLRRAGAGPARAGAARSRAATCRRSCSAREFSGEPKVLVVAASPTRGLDVGAIETVHGYLRDAAADGVAVLLISEDLDECCARRPDRRDVRGRDRRRGRRASARRRRDRAADGGRRGDAAVDADRAPARPAAAVAAGRRAARLARRRVRRDRRRPRSRPATRRCRRSGGCSTPRSSPTARSRTRSSRRRRSPSPASRPRSRSACACSTSAPRASSTSARSAPPASRSASPASRRRLIVPAMIVAGAACGAAWGRDPGRAAGVRPHQRDHHVADAQLRRRARPQLPDLRQPLVLARHVGDRAAVPAGQALPDAAAWPTFDARLGRVPFGFVLAVVVAVVVWVLYTRTRFGFEAQVIGDSPRAARYAGMRTRRKIVAVLCLSGAIAGIGGASQDGDFRHVLDAARAPAGELRLHGHRRRGARALQPVRRRARRVPARRARERRLHAPGRRLPVRARRRDAGDHPVRDARRRAARPLPRRVDRAVGRPCRRARRPRRERRHRRRRARGRRSPTGRRSSSPRSASCSPSARACSTSASRG